MLNRGEEDYLKIIYELSEATFGYVKTKDLVVRLNHTLPSVNEMVKKLVALELILYQPYVGVRLSDEGYMQAENLIKKHRLWELFLTESLGLNEDEVHQEAERLEHATSDRVLEALNQFLGSPKVCPHGRPIPQQISEK